MKHREAPSRPSPAWLGFFGHLMVRRMRAHFHAVRIARAGRPRLPDGAAAVIYCNHSAWWDAALLPVLGSRLFAGRASHAPIDAAALRSYPFLQRIGFFPVEQGSQAGAAALLRRGAALLARPDTLLWITPEGAFSDPRRRPLVLRRGLAALLARAPDVLVQPLAVEYLFWSERTPEALLRFGAPLLPQQRAGRTQAELHALLEGALTEAMDALAVDAMSRDPGRFVTVLDGESGVGGLYDGWRRLKAWWRGERFEAEHAAIRREAEK